MKMTHLKALLLCSWCLGCRDVAPATTGAHGGELNVAPVDADRARELLTSRLRPGETLRETLPWVFPFTGRSIAVGVAVSSSGARRFEVDLDDTEVSLERLAEAEAEAKRERFGKMSPELFDAQVNLSDEDPIEFTVYVIANTTPTSLPYDGTDQAVAVEELNEHIRAHRALVAGELADAKRPLLTWLHDEHVAVEDLDSLPMIKVRAAAHVLRASRLLAADVAGLDTSAVGEARLLGYAGRASMRESSLTGGTCGSRCDGGGLGVGIWEFTNNSLGTIGGIADNNSRLWAAATDTYKNAPTSCTSNTQCPWDPNTFEPVKCVGSKCIEEHVSVVASMIGMNASYTYPPADPALANQTFGAVGATNVVRYIGNDVGVDGMNWILGQTALFVNRSFSSASGTSSFAANLAARNNAVLTAVASGNSGASQIGNSAYFNAVMVGGYSYETWNNATTHHRANWSSFGNNVTLYPGQERPHLLGPGAHQNGVGSTAGLNIPLITGNASGQMDTASLALNGSVPTEVVGTSFASPAVLGAAMQAYQYEGFFSLLYYPIVRKATLLASSVDSNADGEIGKGQEWTASPNDAEDGAGHPDLFHMKKMLDGNQYWYVTLSDNMFVSCGANCRKYTLGTFNATPGMAIKAALVWNACPIPSNGVAYSAPDLDLVLVQPSWCLGALHQSVSVTNEVEMLYDTCLLTSPVAGTYTVEVRIKNGATLPTTCGSTEPVAFAWSKR